MVTQIGDGSRRRTWVRGVLSVLGAAALAAALTGCGEAEKPVAPPPPDPKFDAQRAEMMQRNMAPGGMPGSAPTSAPTGAPGAAPAGAPGAAPGGAPAGGLPPSAPVPAAPGK